MLKLLSILLLFLWSEFLDVFHEDLPRLPLGRDVEFTIELEPSTTAISRPPYHKDPKELAEMKK